MSDSKAEGKGRRHNGEDEDEDEHEDEHEDEEELAQLLRDERKVRASAMRNPLVLFLLDGYSAVKVFGLYLISLESILGCLLSVASAIYSYYRTQNAPSWDGTMDWVLLSFAVVTPMSVSVGLAFRRRERALVDLTVLRSCSYNIYMAHACWDWGTGAAPLGREKTRLIKDDGTPDHDTWLRHGDEALTQLVRMGNELCRFLTLPTSSRARHRVTRRGAKEAQDVVGVSRRLFADVVLAKRMTRITQLTEVLKRNGMPGNEASRIRQWERMMTEAMEDLRVVKSYRSPQALRSFARLFTVFLPPLYGPTFAQLARDVDSLALAIVFAVITSLALTALFESIRVMEDPFVAHVTLDGIDVHEELSVLNYHQLINARKVFYPNAKRFKLRPDDDDDQDHDNDHDHDDNEEQ